MKDSQGVERPIENGQGGESAKKLGRPVVNPGVATKNLSLRLPADVVDDIGVLAALGHTSVTAMVREMLEKHLAGKREAIAQFREALAQ